MAGNVFNRYLWLIELIRREGPITFSEISKKWEYAAINETREKLPRKTFYNHCTKIDEIFDLNIKYKNSFGYYIEEPEESEVWKLDLLNRLLLHSAIKDNPALTDRVKYMDQITDKELPRIIECIQKQSVISFIKPGFPFNPGYVRKPGTNALKAIIDNGKPFSDFLVLAAVEVNFSWFVIGAFVEQDKPFEEWRLSVFIPFHMQEIKVQYEAKNESAKAFSLQKYLDSFAFDPSDTFDDDRSCLAQCLFNPTYRIMYGRLVRCNKTKS